MKKFFILIISIFLIAGLFLLTGCSEKEISNSLTDSFSKIMNSIDDSTTNTSVKDTKTQEAIVIDYEFLHQEYTDNPIAADGKYKGKLLQVTGEIENIDREIMGEPYITFHVGEKYSLKNVRLTFKKSEESKITQLRKGQTITVKGICKGTLLSTTVSLDDCELVD